ncbi:MAG: hypothetical protein ACI9TV_001758, partial [Sulfurimonas sp.]
EMEDYNLNHYIQHFDEIEIEYLEYYNECKYIEAISDDSMEEIIFESENL